MIWCVEDDAGIREIELYALNSTGLGARGFEDGAAFWEALQTENRSWCCWTSCCRGRTVFPCCGG